MRGFAGTLVGRGVRVGGVVQHRPRPNGACRCAEMELISIVSGRGFDVAQPLGPGSRGCRLDFGALASVAQMLMGEVVGGLDLLVLNRFGKAELEGRGFRDVIGAAMAQGIPVLTALNPRNLEGWTVFTEGAAQILPPEEAALMRWFSAGQNRPLPR